MIPEIITTLFPFTKFMVIGMGFLQWLPAIIGGASWLGGKLFGKKPQAPDINAPQYQMGMDWLQPWLEKSQAGLQQQSTNWLEEQMRGYRGNLAGRGLTPATSGSYIDFGDRAAGIASERLGSSLASLYGQAAGMESQMKMAGMGQYGQDYQAWLQNMQSGQENWMSGLMSILAMMPTS